MKFTESETLELKTSTSELKEAIVAIVAMLNKHQKGEVYFGIKNNGDVLGQDVSDKTLREVGQTIADNIEPKIFPTVQNVVIENKGCIYVKCDGKEVPYYAYGRVYIRVADQNKQLSSKEIERLIMMKNREKMRWDNQVCEKATLKDIDEEKVKSFVKKAGLKFTTLENALNNLEIIEDGNLLNSAIILFGKQPQKIFSNFQLRCAIFAGTENVTLLDRQEFNGDVTKLVEDAIGYVRKNTHLGMRVEGIERIDIPEIDTEALREALINAFCHRDYYDPETVDVAVFKNRVEIRNPGGLFGGLTIDQILKGGVAKRRNPLIAKLLGEIHLGEKWGRGIGLILSKEKETTFKEIADTFVTVFKRKDVEGGVTEKVTVKVPEKVTVNQQKILEEIGKNPGITSNSLAQIVGISERKIKENISKLKEKGLLRRVGPDKGGHWEIIN